MMAKKTSVPVTSRGNPHLPSEKNFGPAQRERLIREAAYSLYVQRGFAPGHDLDDWLAAEAEIFSEESAQQPSESVETAETMELNVQGSAVHGFGQDDALKRIIKQHPRKGIPQVESVDPQDAPPKE